MRHVEATLRRAMAWRPTAGSRLMDRPPSFERLMLAEQTHRIANDLTVVRSLLSLLSSRYGEDAEQLVRAALERVDAVADLQRLLLPPLMEGPRELSLKLEEVCRRIAEVRLAKRNVLLDYAVDRCELDARTCWAICAIVAELVTNASKHAFTAAGGTVAVTGRCHGRIVVMSVADDGNGSTASSRRTEPASGGGAGSVIVEQLVAALGGELYYPETSVGTAVEFWIGLDGTAVGRATR
ncbi:ATP-binding protein [Glacieibacterium megasporae]|uniref:ATP-binding protein n=1 Tax=Glacieibacterium megasporae TaxID=2835787 RepID=UPI001C1E26DD|nr:sensor histidine kinase [Polymorphobacter megasporae]UAJ10686.1 sensor histidine kinase [Polymorphobacter megasporae]